MNSSSRIYRGISKAAWGYLLVYFDISFNGISILPDFVGWLFFLSAIECLSEESPELRLLRPFGILLVIWSLIQWTCTVLAIPTVTVSQVLMLPVSLAELYFHFQFLTNLSSVAADRQPEGTQYHNHLLVCRTVQTVALTVTTLVVRCVPGVVPKEWTTMLLLVHMGAAVFTTVTLFALRKNLTEENRQ